MIKAVIFDFGGVIKSSQSLSSIIAGIYNMPVEEVRKLKNITEPFYKLLDKGLIKEEEFWEKVSVAFKKSANPKIEFSGVRSSWLMTAKNRLLAVLAVSA